EGPVSDNPRGLSVRLLMGSGSAEARVACAAVEEVVQPALALLPAVAVALLDAAHELVVVAFGRREIVIRELAPLFLDVAFELLPVALQYVSVHVMPSLRCRVTGRPPGPTTLAGCQWVALRSEDTLGKEFISRVETRCEAESARQARRNSLAMANTTMAPTTATRRLPRLKPVTPAAPNRLNNHPPRTAPIIPRTISVKSPCSRVPMITLASQPARAPKSIHNRMFMPVLPRNAAKRRRPK